MGRDPWDERPEVDAAAKSIAAEFAHDGDCYDRDYWVPIARRALAAAYAATPVAFHRMPSCVVFDDSSRPCAEDSGHNPSCVYSAWQGGGQSAEHAPAESSLSASQRGSNTVREGL